MTAVADTQDGPSQLRISVDDNGDIHAQERLTTGEENPTAEGASASASLTTTSAPAGALGQCSDPDGYILNYEAWNPGVTVTFHVNSGAIPSYMSVTNVKSALDQAAYHMGNGVTTCATDGIP